MSRFDGAYPIGYLVGDCLRIGLFVFYPCYEFCRNVFRRYNNPYVKLTIGGIMLSVLIFLFPPLYGEGYDTINLLLNGVSNQDWDTVMNNSIFYGYGGLLLVYLALIVLFKVFASSATNGGGGCGGIFAPSLF